MGLKNVVIIKFEVYKDNLIKSKFLILCLQFENLQEQ